MLFYHTMYVYYEAEMTHEEMGRVVKLQRKDFVLFLVAMSFYLATDRI
jgi:hypothetical protein